MLVVMVDADHRMNETLDRYHRQMLLPGLGAAAQQRLREAAVMIMGCGALGTVAADGLARAGVGHLVIVDRDFVELTNLQRQVLFDEEDVAEVMPKAEAAKRKLARINSQVEVTAIVDDLNADSFVRHARGADLLVDGLDNFETRYLANDYAVREGIPYFYAGAVGTEGMAATILPGQTPCLHCLFGAPPPPGQGATCDTVGVLGPAVSIIAAFQVAEVIKWIAGAHDRMRRGLLTIDLWDNRLLQLDAAAAPDSECPCCGQRHFDYLEGDAGSSATSLCGRDAVQLRHRQDGGSLDLRALARRLDAHGPVKVNAFMLRAELTDRGKPFELTLFPDGRAIIKGSDDASEARAVYAKYVGS